MSQLLLAKIQTVRRKHAAVEVGCGVATILGAIVLALGLEMIVDWLVELPWGVRAALLVIDMALVAWIVVDRMWRPVTRGPDDDALALEVEASDRNLGHRLIAAVQLSRPSAAHAGASTSLVQAVVAQAEDMVRDMDFARVVKLERLMRTWLITAVILLLGLGALAWGSGDNASLDLLKRALLSNTPVPRKTHVSVRTGTTRMARGESITIEADAHGVRPASGTLFVTTASNRQQEFTMDADPSDPGHFTCRLENVQESFNYRVRLNDGRSPGYDVAALPRPAVIHLDAQQVYPDYTAMGTVPRALGDLTILQGSHLLLSVQTNHRVRTHPDEQGRGNVVHLIGTAGMPDEPLQVSGGDGTRLEADVMLPPKTTGFCINLIDEEGLTSKDPVVYRVDLVPDKEPTVRITQPVRKEVLVTAAGRVGIKYDAADDFGLSRATLWYKLDEGVPRSVGLQIPPHTKAFRGQLDWSMTGLSTATTRPTLEGSTVEYWLEVEDNNNVTGPGRGNSEHYAIKIVTEAQMREELFGELNDVLNRVKGEAQDQEKARDSLGGVIKQSDQPPQHPQEPPP